jgi:DNA-binding transcriptional LysR family regulator
MELVNKDLNLLKVFITVGETLNLTRASEQLNLSQPALSYSLKKLREDFEDPLFVRTSHGFQPTPRAVELMPKVKAVIESSRLLYTSEKLNLKNHKCELKLALTTYFESIVIVKLMEIINKEAPLVRLKTVSLHGEFPKKELESAEIDLAVAAYFNELPENYLVRSLGKDKQVLVMRKNHPYLKTSRSLKDYLSFSHIKIGIPINSTSRVDQQLHEKNLKRKMIGEFNNFLSPLVALKETDGILTVPEKLANVYKSITNLEIAELPMKEITIESKMVWHSRFQNDPFHQWVREILYDIYKN